MSRGTGQGTGGDRQGIGGPNECVCPSCGAKVAHEPGIPCTSRSCPVCGKTMTGVSLSSWESLIFEITKEDIEECVKHSDWQAFREDLKGKSLEEKYRDLKGWLRSKSNSRCAKVQVTNYVNALKRGGQIN